MAVAVTFRIAGATQDDHDRLGAAIDREIEALGGPPDGLLVHVAHADGDDGFIAVEVFRNEAAFEAYRKAVLEPALASAGLTATISPAGTVWSLARP